MRNLLTPRHYDLTVRGVRRLHDDGVWDVYAGQYLLTTTESLQEAHDLMTALFELMMEVEAVPRRVFDPESQEGHAVTEFMREYHELPDEALLGNGELIPVPRSYSRLVPVMEFVLERYA